MTLFIVDVIVRCTIPNIKKESETESMKSLQAVIAHPRNLLSGLVQFFYVLFLLNS